jgi:hypothetical protein
MKENNCKEKNRAVVDEEDSSVTRSDSEYRRLFGASGLEVHSCWLSLGCFLASVGALCLGCCTHRDSTTTPQVRSSRLQTGFPKGMFAIRMYWLQSTEQQVSPPPPAAASQGGETAEAATA